MTSERLSPQIEACPLLGLPNDPRTHFAFAQETHRCHATPKPTPIRLPYQGEVCLTRDFPRCPLYQTWAEAAATRPGAPVVPEAGPRPPVRAVAPIPPQRPPDTVQPPTSGAWPTPTLGSRSAESFGSAAVADVPRSPAYPVARSAVALQPLRPESAERPRGRRTQRVVLNAALILITAAIGFVLAPLILSRLAGAGTPAPSNGAAIIATPSPSASPSASAPVVLVTPSPLPSESAAPSAAPTVEASPSPSGRPAFYIVQSGDNLSAIALRFGTTVERLKQLNKITDASKIYVGQKIILPKN